MSVREPALAGRFYPAAASELASMVDSYLDDALPCRHDAHPAAIAGPHAGFVYSGPIAGSAFAPLRDLAGSLRRAIVIGPSHHIGFDGVATTGHRAFRTPLGDVGVDRAAVSVANEFGFVQQFEQAHAPEHSIETHLPFLQRINPAMNIVPLVTGRCDPRQIAELLDCLTDDETVICVSTDLSHFEDYESARKHDQTTADKVAMLDGDIGPRDACGAVALCGMIELARTHGLASDVIDLRNSGDTAGSRDRVVGYGAFGFWRTQ